MDEAQESIVVAALARLLSHFLIQKITFKKENDCIGGRVTLQETPEESYYKQNLGQASRI